VLADLYIRPLQAHGEQEVWPLKAKERKENVGRSNGDSESDRTVECLRGSDGGRGNS
jgi:hypothetical protein